MAPAATTTWAVRLGTTSEGVEGTLSLVDDALVFTMEEHVLRIALADVKKAKRTRGSPILVVEHVQEGDQVAHAFFFAKPPPLKPVEGKSKRKNARQSILYLQNNNRDLKPIVSAWETAIRDAQNRA